MRLLALATFLFAVTAGAAPTGRKTHLDFRTEARAAYERKDFATALAATREALALRPDSPRYLHNLAALLTLTGDRAAALESLQRIADLGVVTNIERDPDLAPLQGTPEFRRILDQFAAHREPRGQAEVIGELPGRAGIIEGIAFHRRSGDLFFGDVRLRCIWRRSRDGQITRFSAEDEELLGVFGVAIDEGRNTLWAALSAVPEMEGYDAEMKGRAAVAEFDLTNGEIRRIVHVPDDGRDHSVSDLTLGPGGVVYASDSKSPVVWQLSPDADEFQKAVDSPLFSSLQGVIVDRGILLVADYANGLFAVELATGNITAFAPPPNTTLLGLDGLVSFPGGLVAIQNGTTPQRVLRIGLSPDLTQITDVRVLTAGLPDLTDLALVTLVDDRPTFIAGAGWDALETPASGRAPARTVKIFHLELQ